MNDSGQVLALSPNRWPRTGRDDFGEDAPFAKRSGIRRKCALGY